MSTELLPLDALAARLELPRTYLRRLAETGEIPSLDANGRLRFDVEAVGEALRLLAKSRQCILKEHPAGDEREGVQQ